VKQNEHKPRFKFPEDSFAVSPEAKDLISGLLVNNPGKVNLNNIKHTTYLHSLYIYIYI
jgi:hypothetical protein